MRKTTNKQTYRLKRGDKAMLVLIAIFAFIAPVITVYTSATLSSSNIEVEKLKRQIEKQENINSGLSMQVDELASLSNIQNIAKENGLSYNNDNIIVIK